MSFGITVFSKPACVQCTMTKKVLDREGLSYTLRDVSEDAEALEFVTQLGYQAAPVVFITDGTVADRKGEPINHWSGLRPDLLAQL